MLFVWLVIDLRCFIGFVLMDIYCGKVLYFMLIMYYFIVCVYYLKFGCLMYLNKNIN